MVAKKKGKKADGVECCDSGLSPDALARSIAAMLGREEKIGRVFPATPEISAASRRDSKIKDYLNGITGDGFMVSMARVFFSWRSNRAHRAMWGAIRKKYPMTDNGRWALRVSRSGGTEEVVEIL